MTDRILRNGLLAIVCAVALAAGPAVATDRASDKTTAADVRQEIADVTEAMKEYAETKKSAAQDKAEAALRKIDARIEAFEAKVDRQWDAMTRPVQRKARAALAEIRARRTDVAEWYGGMKHSSVDAWREVRDGFVEAYDALGQSFGEALDEFDDDVKSKTETAG